MNYKYFIGFLMLSFKLYKLNKGWLKYRKSGEEAFSEEMTKVLSFRDWLAIIICFIAFLINLLKAFTT